MVRGLHVPTEIGTLKRVMLHRPGDELLNLPPDELDRLLFDDIPFLPVAQEEHDAFAQTLENQGVEVLYLENLVAEALDAVPGARDEFTRQWIAEANLLGRHTPGIVKDYLDSFANTCTMVKHTMAGITRHEVELPHKAPRTLRSIVGADGDTESDLLVDPMPNLYFTRDPFCTVGNGVNVNRMYSITRNRETIYGEYIFKYHPNYRDCPQWYRRNSPYHIEGGDVLNLNGNAIAVGISQRTEAAAIDKLANHMFWGGQDCPVREIYAFNIPSSRAFMHLDTVFTQIDVDKFTIHPAIMGTLQVFRMTPGTEENDVRITEMNDTLEHTLAKILGLDRVTLIPCGGGDPIAAAREQWNDGSNTLCVRPGTICVYQRNNVTNEVLYKAGMELLVIPSAELSRGRGGPRCMSMPFWREDL